MLGGLDRSKRRRRGDFRGCGGESRRDRTELLASVGELILRLAQDARGLGGGVRRVSRFCSDDGLLVFQSMIAWLESQAKAKAA